jgi:hypothetical protein
MARHTKFSIEPAFINREKELGYLIHWINSTPDNILFLYGPKSSGKTTLLKKFIQCHLPETLYVLKHFNLRKMMINNYSDFIQSFFDMNYSKSSKDLKRKREYNLKLFKLSHETKKSLEQKSLDPFFVMETEILSSVKKGKRPIIIIDEIQALEDIYINGQRELVKEIFNFFVALTKEDHICHVIIASSDGYFLSKIYNDSKLTKTSTFFKIDYLSQQDTISWLKDLQKNSSITALTLSDSQIQTIWHYIGGSMWEISKLLFELIPYAQNKTIDDHILHAEINLLTGQNKAKLEHYVKYHDDKYALIKKIYDLHLNASGFLERHLKQLISDGIYDSESLTNELIELVHLNILFFNPTTSVYKLQGQSIFFGMKKFFEEL